jgi:hypothetical protein
MFPLLIDFFGSPFGIAGTTIVIADPANDSSVAFTIDARGEVVVW